MAANWWRGCSRILSSRAVLLRVAVVLTMAASISSALAQTAARPDKGVRPAGSYSVSDIENINMTNGNLNISIPLASLPPTAGGRLSWTINAVYNSKMWDMYSTEEEDTSTVPPTRWMTQHLQPSAFNSWIIGGQYRLEVIESHDDTNWLTPLSSDSDFDFLQQVGESWYKVTLTTPDGAVHELRPFSTATFYPSEYLREYLNGYSTTTPATSGTMTYYSYDGSYLWAAIQPWSPSVNGLTPPDWDVYMPDGTRIKNRSGKQWIRDTNGNAIRIKSDTVGTVTTTHYRDEETLREIQYVFDTSLDQGQVKYQVEGGAWASVLVNFDETSVHGWTYLIGDPVCPDVAELIDTDITVISSIILPQTEPGVQRKFEFGYNSDSSIAANYPWRSVFCTNEPPITSMSRGVGSLNWIKTPNSSEVNYTYLLDQTGSFSEHNAPLMNPADLPADALTKKEIEHDGVTETPWTYSPGLQSGFSTMQAPDGTFIEEHSYPRDRAFQITHGGALGKGGLTYRTKRSNKVIIERRWKHNSVNGFGITATGSEQSSAFNPVVDIEFTTLLDSVGSPSKMSARKFVYDFNGNVISENQYDWFTPIPQGPPYRDEEEVPYDVPSGLQPTRVITNTYHNEATDPNSNNIYYKRINGEPPTPFILNALKQVKVGNATTTLSKTRFHYDGNNSDPGYDTAPTFDLVTKERRDKNGTWIDTFHTYDAFGNRISTTDPKGNVTTFTYDPATHTQPVSVVVDPNNQVGGDEHTTLIEYDYYTGLVKKQTDPNGNETLTDYTNQVMADAANPIKDPYGRPGVVTGPSVPVNIDGAVSNHMRKVATRYFDNIRQVELRSDLNAENDGKLRSRTTVDQLGRTVLTETSEDGGTTFSLKTEAAHEKMGQVTYSSNPRRTAAASTDGWTRAKNDNLGRVIEVATFSGATKPTEIATNWNGKISTSYSVNETTVTDQDGKTRKSVLDGLGRLIKVYEAPSSLNYETTYEYDALGNLTKVIQGGQTREFGYDTLSRLISAKNPEQVNLSGQMVATTYLYDDASNLLTRTNPNGTTVTFTYDGLNRVKTKTLSTGTWTYTYDTGANAKGRLTSVKKDNEGYFYDGYDAAGRLTASHQVTNMDGQDYSYSFTYGYDLAGNLTSQVYPSGKEYRNSYDLAGRLFTVDRWASDVFDKVYASGFTYTAHGAISTVTLGSNVAESMTYNSRLQPNVIELRKLSGNALILGLDYDFGSTNNNGNVREEKITIGHQGVNTIITQTFGYDALNRLQTFSESGGGPSQTYSYDRFGNRWVSQSTGWTPNPTLCPTQQSHVSATTNRITLSGFNYDFNGNQTNQIRNGQNETLSYDSENHLITFASGSTTTNYTYDGDGRRVKKVVGTQKTIFVYNAGGQLVAEYTTPEQQSQGDGGTSYLTTDHLGSTRVITDSSGSVRARYDYLPFGEELGSSIGARTSQMGYSQPNNLRQRFTQYERDGESGLDYAEARYYSASQGRFTSVDDLLSSGFMEDPQSWHRYCYGRNNPMLFVDPSGHDYLVSINDKFSYHSDQDFEAWRNSGEYFVFGGHDYGLIFEMSDGVIGDFVGWYAWYEPGKVKAGTVVTGVGKEIANTAIDFLNLITQMSKIDPNLKRALTLRNLTANNSEEEIGMWASLVASFLSGRGEAKAATKQLGYIARFLKANPNFEKFSGEMMQIHHRIPQMYFRKGLFRSDMNSLSNLYALPKDIHQKIVTPAWNKFARENPNATAAQVMKFAIDMDKRIAQHINQIGR